MMASGQAWRRALLAGLLLAALVVGLALEARAQTPLGQVVVVRGHVGLIRDGVTQAVVPGTEVVDGDRVVTGGRSMVALSVVGGAMLTAGNATDLTVTRYVKSRDGHILALDLDRGILRADLHRGAQWQAVMIAAPTAIATTESGALVVEADMFDATVYSLDTRVQVASAPAVLGETGALLGAGMGIDVRRGEPAARPQPWAEVIAAPLLARTDLH